MSRKLYKNMQHHIQNYEAKYKNSKTNLGVLKILTNIAFYIVRNSGLFNKTHQFQSSLHTNRKINCKSINNVDAKLKML